MKLFVILGILSVVSIIWPAILKKKKGDYK